MASRPKSIIALWFATGGILVTAVLLTADPSGMGTHTQLGLGECHFLKTTGLPCPMCGMTTTFTHMAHFHWLEAMRVQPFGVVLFFMTFGTFVISTLELIKPADRFRRLFRHVMRYELFWAFFLMGGLLLGWLYKVGVVKGLIAW